MSQGPSGKIPAWHLQSHICPLHFQTIVGRCQASTSGMQKMALSKQSGDALSSKLSSAAPLCASGHAQGACPRGLIIWLQPARRPTACRGTVQSIPLRERFLLSKACDAVLRRQHAAHGCHAACQHCLAVQGSPSAASNSTRAMTGSLCSRACMTGESGVPELQTATVPSS